MRVRYESGKLAWIAPGAVYFDREQVELLLPWLRDMREGAYPNEPAGDDEGHRSGINSQAPFEVVCQVAAELDARLAMTGLDRVLVEGYYCFQQSAGEIAREYGKNEQGVLQSINNAVSFISSGKCRRWADCLACLGFPKCRKKKKLLRQVVTYAEWCRRKNRRAGQVLKTS